MKMRPLFLTLFLTICFSINGQVDAFQQEIIELLQCNGTQEKNNVAYDEVFVVLKKNFETANVPEDLWVRLKTDRLESLATLTQFLSFAYHNQFTRSEIAEMTVFFQSNAAQKRIAGIEELTEADSKEINDFNDSAIGKKWEARQEALAVDMADIFGHWRRDLFSEKMSILVKEGYRSRQ